MFKNISAYYYYYYFTPTEKTAPSERVREREYEVEKIDMTTHEAQQCGNSAGIIHGVRHTSFFNFPLPQFLSDGIC